MSTSGTARFDRKSQRRPDRFSERRFRIPISETDRVAWEVKKERVQEQRGSRNLIAEPAARTVDCAGGL
jgi:hypothetical protein